MGNPADDQGLGAVVPERVVNRVVLGIDHIQAVLGRRVRHFDRQSGGEVGHAVVAGEGQGINAGLGERGGGFRRARIGEGNCARAGSLGPGDGHRRAGRAAAAPPPALRRPPPPRRAAGLR